MKHWVLLLIIITAVSVTACSNNINNSEKGTVSEDGAMSEEGYIISKDKDRILVVGGISQEDVQSTSVEDILNGKGSSAAWFDIPDDLQVGDLQVGQKVKVWFSVMAESYPGQATAQKVQVINE
ncbi:YobA family protein [Chengkuizengella sp. SCS-71B]|uniref:YobA family protein n=1 Tax=Chengkuizengella sp. SCS-71B TaxID=3115290 RepID=UPI0032C22DD3